ncbi:DUF3306 domain-containing protein [Palleronia sp.]|uniref:DUF3306 domain-containing protein n=1 Tax=Palleronia sp. TaxID=1940284 RepID=UPI0035C7EB74
MSDKTESFVHRWSRRAQQARHEEAAEPAPPAELPEVEPAPPPEQQQDLPDIETLDGTSDYTAFLGANVPKALRAAALRKAWTSDPSIAAHRPLVEYDWDCNAPGYGRLKPNALSGKLTRDLLRHFQPKGEAPDEPSPVVRIAEAEAPPEVHVAEAEAPPAPATIEDAPEPPPQAQEEEDRQDVDAADAPEMPAEHSRPRHGGARPA